MDPLSRAHSWIAGLVDAPEEAPEEQPESVESKVARTLAGPEQGVMHVCQEKGLLNLQKDEKSGGYILVDFGPNA